MSLLSFSDAAETQEIYMNVVLKARIRRTALVLSMLFAAMLAPETYAQDLSGVWRGRWTADATPKLPEHGGALRMRLTPTGFGTYQGRFSGRFALVIPYFYRAEVRQNGNQIISSKRLGPMGSYTMRLSASPSRQSLSGRWSAGKHHGSIRVRRIR
ncbi:MAG: hypothetical protein AAGG44_06170 [Planctomycetota bacterium]